MNSAVVHTLIYKHTDAEGGQSLTAMNTAFIKCACGKFYYLFKESIHCMEAVKQLQEKYSAYTGGRMTMKTIMQDYRMERGSVTQRSHKYFMPQPHSFVKLPCVPQKS